MRSEMTGSSLFALQKEVARPSYGVAGHPPFASHLAAFVLADISPVNGGNLMLCKAPLRRNGSEECFRVGWRFG